MRMSRFPLISLLVGILLSFSPSVSFADITAVSKGGQSLLLYKDYYALVIGVSNYQKWPKILFAMQDASEVSGRLEQLGFKTKLVLDPTHREMLTALTEMVYVLGRDENRGLLLYYAGHGETETLADRTKMGYIVPKDCPLLKDDPMGFVTHAISMREIESISLRIRSRHVLMLFDSCFSGSLFALVRAIPHDITEKSTLPVRQYITAGSEDEEVPDRSIFKRCFLIGLEGDADLTGDGYITGSELGMYLSDKVVNYTNRQQHPQYGKINNPDLDRGDFIFVPLKRQERGVTSEKGAVEERSEVAEELKLLREERGRNQELVAELKKLIQEREQAGKTAASDEKAKLELEAKLKEAQKESKVSEEMMASRIKELEGKLSLAEDRMRQEAQQEKVDKGPQLASIPQVTPVPQAASIPHGTTETKLQKIALRSVPTRLGYQDIKSMIEKYDFPVQASNPNGKFPKEYNDNGDGTITDEVTGLVWEKEGAPSLYYWEAQSRIEILNERKTGGHSNWRIPTLEELCSLLDSPPNSQGYYIPSVFGNPQAACWTSDIDAFAAYAGIHRLTVNFSNGDISAAPWQNTPTAGTGHPQRLYLKAVRTSVQPQMTARAERPGPAESAKTDEDPRVALLPGETKSDVNQSKKAETERRQPQTVSVPTKAGQAPSPAEGQEVARDGVYIAYANGIVKDTKTGLEWVAGPDKPMNRDDAKAWVESLNVGGGGWRLPTVAELKGLYQYGKGRSNMTPLLKTTESWVWSSQHTVAYMGLAPRYFNFNNGQESFYSISGHQLTSLQFFRAFAVRSRSSG